MFISADTIEFVRDCNLPPTEILEELGAVAKPAIFGRKWVNNGIKGTHEPRITFYPTWRRNYRILVGLELSKIKYGYNVLLLSESEIRETLHLVSTNVEARTTIPFDAFNVELCRIDYAANLYFEPAIARKFIARYYNYSIPNLIRNVTESTTVSFQNDSRTISVYDKAIQMSKKKNVPSEVRREANGLVRLEYGLKDANSVNRFAKRLGFEDSLAKTLLSPESIRCATDEMIELLNIENFEPSDDSRVKIIHNKINDIKKAIQLDGFCSALDEYGEDFYLRDGMDMSRSTYNRLKKECQDIGF
jgi:hypothetical protein